MLRSSTSPLTQLLSAPLSPACLCRAVHSLTQLLSATPAPLSPARLCRAVHSLTQLLSAAPAPLSPACLRRAVHSSRGQSWSFQHKYRYLHWYFSDRLLLHRAAKASFTLKTLTTPDLALPHKPHTYSSLWPVTNISLGAAAALKSVPYTNGNGRWHINSRINCFRLLQSSIIIHTI